MPHLLSATIPGALDRGSSREAVAPELSSDLVCPNPSEPTEVRFGSAADPLTTDKSREAADFGHLEAKKTGEGRVEAPR